MYDNIKFWIDRFEIGDEVFQSLPSHLTSANRLTDLSTGETKIVGSLNNLRVVVNESGISVKGSLSRFFHIDEDNGRRGNLFPLDRHDTQKAIEKMCQKMGGVPMDKAKVRALEFGSFILVNNPVADYLKRCGSYPRLERCQFHPQTLYYKGKGKRPPRVLCLYDKRADARAKGYELPQGFERFNLLKFEMRLNGSVGRQLLWGEVIGATLYEQSFYKRVAQVYQEEFAKIVKLPQTTDLTGNIKSVGDGVEVLLSRLIKKSGIEVIDSFIDELKCQNTFADRANYSRLKKKLCTIVGKSPTGDNDSLLSELQNGINNLTIYV